MKADAGDETVKPDARPGARPSESAADNDSLTDLFAVDLFAAHRAPAAAMRTGANESRAVEPSPGQGGATDNVRWDARLRRVAADRARLSSALAAIPTSIFTGALRACTRVFAGYCNVPESGVAVTVIDLREAAPASMTLDTETAQALWASLSVEPDGSRLVVEMNAEFVVALADRALGGDGRAPASLRHPSVGEQAVVEFLWLCFFRELNAELREPLFRLDALRTKPPAWLTNQEHAGAAPASQATSASMARGLVAVIRVAVGTTVGIARCGLTYGALASLNAQHPLLAREPPARALSEKLARYKRVAPEIALRLFVGETEVEASELAHLDYGDVMLVERQYVRRQAGQFAGRVRLHAGEGAGVVLIGTTQNPRELQQDAPGTGAQAGEAATVSIVIETIYGGETNNAATEQLKMEEEEKIEGTIAEGAAALDGLMLTVHVELAARRIGLEELSRLRAGQVLELGCSATDAVDLISEGRRIARGELVDLEGRLGVLIIQVVK